MGESEVKEHTELGGGIIRASLSQEKTPVYSRTGDNDAMIAIFYVFVYYNSQ